MPATQPPTYPGFDHKAEALSAYVFSRVIGLFIISLKNGDMVHFQPEDTAAFEQWLRGHKVRNIQRG